MNTDYKTINDNNNGRRFFEEEWPYPVEYNSETEVETDVLVIGGGVAGCHAAIAAAKQGMRVAILDKGNIMRSGSGGAGVDHWHGAYTNPCSKVTPDEYIKIIDAYPMGLTSEFGNGITSYIMANESWDALLDIEKMGGKIRDTDDEFKGADFRDEKTKLLFAYDYENRTTLRVFGWGFKPLLYKELKRLGVNIFNRVMGTGLLTENGEAGARVTGATAINVRTGRFYIFKAKSTILTTAQPLRLWMFNTELQGFASIHDDPNCAGDGCAMAWKAGAELALMEKSSPISGGFRYMPYGTGNCSNTWFPCNIVDAEGREIPWMDRDGRILKTFAERVRPAPGQKFMIDSPNMPYEFKTPTLIWDLPERVAKGEYKLPFYSDLASMPEHERRAIFGLMIGNEGNTRYAIYDTYTKAGFDPDRDLLMVPVQSPSAYNCRGVWWWGTAPSQWRESADLVNAGGIFFDWDLKSSLEGLYMAGNQLAGGANHAASAATGRYAGRHAAEYAKSAKPCNICRHQAEKEKERVYAPLLRDSGTGWKELAAGLCRIMQDYCGEFRSENTLKLGLEWMESIRKSELANACARNPHELLRLLECEVRLTVGEAMMHSSLARKSTCPALGFTRIDYPDPEPEGSESIVVIKKDGTEVKTRTVSTRYYLEGDNAPTFRENYERHALK